MKLDIKRDSTKKQQNNKTEQNNDAVIILLRQEVENLKEQNKQLAAQFIKIVREQKRTASEIVEMIEIVKRFDSFKKEIANRFSEFAEYFEENENKKNGAESLDYGKLALIVHKYNLVSEKKNKGSKK